MQFCGYRYVHNFVPEFIGITHLIHSHLKDAACIPSWIWTYKTYIHWKRS